MTPLQELTAGLLREVAIPGEAPGAVAAAAVTAALAAALGRSATVPAETAALLEALERAVLLAGDRDTRAYTEWRAQRGSFAGMQESAAEVVRITESIDDALAATAGAEGLNAIDVSVARLLCRAAAASGRVVGIGNAAAAEARTPTPRSARNEALVHGAPAPTPAKRSGRAALWLPGCRPNDAPRMVVRRAWRCWVEDAEARTWFDATSGMWNVPLGHGRIEVVDAFVQRAQSLHAIDPFQSASVDAYDAAEALVDYTGVEGHVLFSSSGSEAVETALRVALMASPRGAPVYALPGAFHGTTAGAALLSGFESVWGPYPPAVRFVTTAAPSEWRAPGIGFIEPVQGAGGGESLPAAYVRALDAFRRAGGIVVADEVACGLGRAGGATASSGMGLAADIFLFGKGLANGVAPVSATVVSSAIAERLAGRELEDGHTHSNHPPSMAAAAATLRIMSRESTHLRAEETGALIRERLSASGVPVAGRGCFLRVLLPRPIRRDHLFEWLGEARLLVHIPTSLELIDRFMLVPPLDLTRDEIAALIDRAAAVYARARAT